MSTPELLDQELTDRLRDHGLRVTTQRLLLHRFLREHPRHVTAEQIQRGIAPQLPGVSTQTVYSTLELFEQLDLVVRVPSPSGVVLFDSRVHPHHHLLCRACGALSDVDADVDVGPALAAGRATGFAPDSGSVTVLGLCAGCAAAAA